MASTPPHQLTIAYYVTGHGYGHATRVVEVCRHLIARGHLLHVVTAAPERIFRRELDADALAADGVVRSAPGGALAAVRAVVLDVGARQHDALSVDRKGSLEAYARHSVLPRHAQLATEVGWLRSAGPGGAPADLVVSDIVPLACAAAREAGVPCAAVSNFSWDFVYSDYLTEAGADMTQSLVWQIAEDYACADLCLRLPGFTPMPAFREVVDVPLVVRHARRPRAAVRAELGVGPAERLLLFNFGGQAADWGFKESFLPPGWKCVICTALAVPSTLPPNFVQAERDVYVPDIMLAADAILGKIGYGTTSEALAHGTPFIFVRRDYFNEEPFLLHLLRTHGFAVEIARRDFFSGNWGAHLRRAAAMVDEARAARLVSAAALPPATPGAAPLVDGGSADPGGGGGGGGLHGLLYDAPTNGGEVVAASLEKLARGELPSGQGLGPAARLQDAVVYGYKMLRAGKSLNVPEWYGAAGSAGLPSPRAGVASPRQGSVLSAEGAGDPAGGGGAADTTLDQVAASSDIKARLWDPASEAAAADAGAPDSSSTASRAVPADTASFLHLLSQLRGDAAAPPRGARGACASSEEWRASLGLFAFAGAGAEPLYVSRAPGRLDVMGGIADYSGSAVLQMPIAQACHVAAQRQPTDTQPRWKHQERGEGAPAPTLRIVSLGADTDAGPGRSFVFDCDMSELLGDGSSSGGESSPPSYAAVQAKLKEEPARAWAAYVAGGLVVLAHEKGVVFEGGMSLLVHGAVPNGKGVSSSASVEVASMQAVAAAAGVALDPRELALLCQKVENLIVGAPCGVMDQMASSMGFPDALMAMDCRPAEVRGAVKIPPHLKFWGIDSGIRHSVGGADYGSVRVGAFMGRRIMAVRDVVASAESGGVAGRQASGSMTVASAAAVLPAASDKRYLATMPASRFQQQYAAALPETLGGAEFLRTYGGHGDEAVTAVDPMRTYAVRAPTAHPVFENFRVKNFEQLLAAPDSDAQLVALGELMYQSHASYSLCGLGSDGTDRLVELVAASALPHDDGDAHAGPLFGAKITGGGSGGTVCVLGRNSADGEAAVRDVIAKYAAATGHTPMVFSGSSMGAGTFKVLEVSLEHAKQVYM
jgi:L-arabinokinase